jgi:1-deoxy-D-xylulose-5-phosphate synthase
MHKLIDTLQLPEDLKRLSLNDLRQVVIEVRDELIHTISECGGHFASSLGATEISVVLHHLFEAPFDKIIWDVGHQGYIHKMLTGRRDKMSSIRQRKGISGYLRRAESIYDAFGAGHAGTSISAGLGMAVALAKQDPERFVVSVIGDGSLTCGMAFEALNHGGELGLSNFIVILNDNEMSISPNVGANRWLFSKAMTSWPSTIARSQIKSLHNKGIIPDTVYKAIDRAEAAAQGFFSEPAMLFESFRFRYIGPVNGHCIEDLCVALKAAKEQDVPVLIHARTAKGQGYQFAEEDPITWHAVKPFDKDQGKFYSVNSSPVPIPPTYTDIFAKTVLQLCRKNDKVVTVTAAMAEGTGLELIRKELPESFFDVGICEQHAVTFSAGLSCEGYIPICAIYSTFLQRAFDQIVHDVCIQNLPVIFAIDRAGVVGHDGETHQGVFDISYLRCLPNIKLMAPSDENELQKMLYFNTVSCDGPTAIRYPRGSGVELESIDKLMQEVTNDITLKKGTIRRFGNYALFICIGPILQDVLVATNELASLHGIECSVIDARFIKPLDLKLFSEQIPKFDIVCTVEDHVLAGGFGSAILELLVEQKIPVPRMFHCFGIPDKFVEHGSQAEQLGQFGITKQHFVNFILQTVSNNPFLAQTIA